MKALLHCVYLTGIHSYEYRDCHFLRLLKQLSDHKEMEFIHALFVHFTEHRHFLCKSEIIFGDHVFNSRLDIIIYISYKCI